MQGTGNSMAVDDSLRQRPPPMRAMVMQSKKSVILSPEDTNRSYGGFNHTASLPRKIWRSTDFYPLRHGDSPDVQWQQTCCVHQVLRALPMGQLEPSLGRF